MLFLLESFFLVDGTGKRARERGLRVGPPSLRVGNRSLSPPPPPSPPSDGLQVLVDSIVVRFHVGLGTGRGDGACRGIQRSAGAKVLLLS